MSMSLCRYLHVHVLPVLHKADVAGIFIFVDDNTIKKKTCPRPKGLKTILSIQYVHGDLYKQLGIDSSTIRILESIPKCLYESPCVCQIFKMIFFCSSFGIPHVFSI